eukprot:758244-Rhodomonas_salina.4
MALPGDVFQRAGAQHIISVGMRYAMSRTQMAHDAIRLRACYATAGTDLAHSNVGLLAWRTVVPAYAK